MMIFLNIILFFFVGLVEAFLLSTNSKMRQYSRKFLTFVSSFINILVWYWIIRSVMEGNLSNWVLVSYAVGYALGDVQAINFSDYLFKLAKKRGFKRKIKKLYRFFKR